MNAACHPSVAQAWRPVHPMQMCPNTMCMRQRLGLFVFLRPATHKQCGGCRCFDQPVEPFRTGACPATSQAASRSVTSLITFKLQSSTATPWPQPRPHCLVQCQLCAANRLTWERLALTQRPCSQTLSSHLPGSHQLPHLTRTPCGEQAALCNFSFFVRNLAQSQPGSWLFCTCQADIWLLAVSREGIPQRLCSAPASLM